MIIIANASPSALPSASSSSNEKEDGQFSALLNDRLSAGSDKKAPANPADNRIKHSDLRKDRDASGELTLNDLTGLEGSTVAGTDILNLQGLPYPHAPGGDESQVAEGETAQALPLPALMQAVPLPVGTASGQDGKELARSAATDVELGSGQNMLQQTGDAARSTTELQIGRLQGMTARTGADLPSLSGPQSAPPLETAPALTEAKYSPILLTEQGIAAVQADSDGMNTLMTNASLNMTETTSVKPGGAAESDLPLSMQTADINPVGKSTLSAVTDVTTRTIAQPVGTPAWQHALSQQLSYFTRNGIQHAELRLHPEDLGALQINLQLNNDRAQLHFITANHQVRAAIEAAMPHLRTSLEESGISLGQSSVGEDASSSWHASSEPDSGTRSYPHADNDDPDGVISEEPAGVQRVRLYDGINTFV